MTAPAKVNAADVSERLAAMAETPPLSVAVIDIDGFGKINDSHGRAVGDAVIAWIGEQLAEQAAGAFVARTGGDEFLCAFAPASPEQALLRMEAIRARIEQPQTILGVPVAVSISTGIASFPHHIEDPWLLPCAAQEAMQKAKSEGGNRAVIYVEEKMVLKSNYYSRAQLARLSALAHALGCTEAALLRQALNELVDRHRGLT